MMRFLQYDAPPEHSLIHACKFCHSQLLESTKDKFHRDGSVVNIKDRPWSSFSDIPCVIDSKARRNWGFAFAHASRSSKSILFALRWLQISPNVHFGYEFLGTSWIVHEMIEWLKVYAGTILIQANGRNSNYWEGTNS